MAKLRREEIVGEEVKTFKDNFLQLEVASRNQEKLPIALDFVIFW